MAQTAYSDVIKTPGISTVFSTGEGFTQSTGATYQINDVTKRVWDRDVTPTVYVDGVSATPTAIDYLFGKVTVPSTGTVTVSGNYLPMSTKTGFNMHTIAEGGTVLENTTFDNNAGYIRRQLGLNDVSAQLGGFQNPWFYDFTDTTKNLETALAVTGQASTTFTIGAGHGLSTAGGEHIRIDDEVFLTISVSTTNVATAYKAQYGSVEAAHTTDEDVFTMNQTHYSRNPFLLEIRPNGSSNDVIRGWFVVESKEHSGDVNTLEQNSVSLVLDGEPGAAFSQSAE